MKVKSFNAHIVSTKQLRKDPSRNTLNQFMKVESFHAHIVCCGSTFVQKGSLQKHMKSVNEGEKFLCTQCDYQANWRGDLCKHMKSVHEGQQFQCTHCEYNIQSITERSTSDTHEVSPWRPTVSMHTLWIQGITERSTSETHQISSWRSKVSMHTLRIQSST